MIISSQAISREKMIVNLGLVTNPEYLFISVCGSKDKPLFDLGISGKYNNILSLQFDDIWPSTIMVNGDRIDCIQLPTNEQLISIIDFILKYENITENKYNLLVNCMAGISRSGAISQFIYHMCSIENDAKWARDNRHIAPNDWIFQSLCNKILKRRRL